MTRHKRFHRISGYLYLLPYLLLFAGFLVIPLLFGLGLSFVRWDLVSFAPPSIVGLDNYREALADEYFWRALKATMLFVAMAVPLTVGLALLVALGLATAPQRRGLYRAAFFIPVIINISVASILWRWFFNSEFGLFNGYLSVIGTKVPWITDVRWAMPSIVLMTLWWTVGGPAVILLAGLQQIPGQYYEAAALDGATGFARFRHITLPLLRPVMLFVTVINIIASFQLFGQTFMITQGGPELSTRVLVQYIYETAFHHYRLGYGAAMSWLLFAIIAVFSFVQFRVMREK